MLVGVSAGCLMGCFRAPPPWQKTAHLKRPIKRSMTKARRTKIANRNRYDFPRKSENSRRLWLFPGSLRFFLRKTPGKSQENCWKKLPESREMLQILGFGAPGKANLPGTLGRHCLDLVPTFLRGVFFEIDSSSLLEFFLARVK